MELLTPSFLRRLHLLRDRISGILRKFELYRTAPTGHLVTPEADSHRPYTPGDDPRYIDWSIYARQERFFVKTVVREDEGVVRILVDTSSSMRSPHASKFQRGLEAAAALGYLALLAGNQMVLHPFSDHLLLTKSYDQGEKDTFDLLHQLQTLPQGSRTDLGRALKQLEGVERETSSRTVIISDFIDKGPYWEQIKILRSRGAALAAIQMIHAREISPRLRGYLQIQDPETDLQVTKLIGHRLKKEYQASVENFLHDTSSRFHEMGIPFLRKTTETPFEELVLEFFKLHSWNTWR
jgi:uncharacterized protein (DUF58 family)